MDGEKVMPTGVKVISVLYYVLAVFSLLFAFSLVNDSPGSPLFLGGLIILGMFVRWAIFFLLFELNIYIGMVIVLLGCTMAVFIGHGLWKGKNWARIGAIVLAIFGILGGVLSLIYGFSGFQPLKVLTLSFAFVRLAVSLLIGGYLAFAHEVKEAFAQ